MQTQVIIIGAGPTGLMAACQLARLNINFIIIDSKPAPVAESRAMLVTARSMEIYRQMGLADTVLKEGQVIDSFSIFMNGREKATLKTTNAGQGLTDFPNLQAFEQFKNEDLLYTDLKMLGHDVLWRTSLVSFAQNEDGLQARLYDKTDPFRDFFVEADYLLGCDGASSTVRQQLGLDFIGGTYQNKFFVADVNLNWLQPTNKLIASLSRQSFCAFFPMYGNGSYRILGTLPQHFMATEEIDFDDLKPVIHSTAKIPFNIETLNWFSVYKLHHRCVDEFKVGHCFLLGDAAHIHSPAGGQGMNTGLQDAYNLTWKLAMVLNKAAAEPLLNTYHDERYPFAQWLLRFTDNIFGFMTGQQWYVYYFRRCFIPIFLKWLLAAPFFSRRAFKTLSQIGYSYRKSRLSINCSSQKLKFKAGDRCPHILIDHDGHQQSLLSLLTETKFYLLCVGDIRQHDFLPAHLQGYINVINLPHAACWHKAGVKGKLFILLRPDQYIGLVSDEMNTALLSGYFNNFK
ncbi:FAD-dependent monooxygenase [Mucilaginibacter celer]|uniref:FAD-dependent monooxygenase n=1 Tax=Mucilaginibacter celer TaxID=2305508 RepID=UPI0013CE4401|nr:FAD-dependent monooxygenase [Mucilaginibacter celer]